VLRLRLNQPVAKSTIERFISFDFKPVGEADGVDIPDVIIEVDPDSRDIPEIMPAPGEVYGLDFGPQSPNVQKADDELTWIDGEPARSVWLVKASHPLPSDHNINLKVTPGLASAEGPELGIENRVIVNFDTFPAFKFLGVKCRSNDGKKHLFLPTTRKKTSKCNPLYHVNLSFSAPVLSSEVEAHMALIPPLDGGREDYNPWDNIRDYSRLRSAHRKDRTYDINLPERLKAASDYNLKMASEDVDDNSLGAIRDEFGRRLADDIDMTFITDHRPENFLLTHKTAVLEHGIDSDIPLHITNLDKVSINYRSLTQEGQTKDQSAERAGSEDVKDIQFTKPLKIKDLLSGKSGAVPM